MLYPQTENGNYSKIEVSRLVDKVIEKQKMINFEISNHKLTGKKVRLQVYQKVISTFPAFLHAMK